MFIKLSKYKSVKAFTITCVLLLVVILVALACDLNALKEAMEAAHLKYQTAEMDLAAHRAMMPEYVVSATVGSAVGVGVHTVSAVVITSVVAMNPATGATIIVGSAAGAYALWYTKLCFKESA